MVMVSDRPVLLGFPIQFITANMTISGFLVIFLVFWCHVNFKGVVLVTLLHVLVDSVKVFYKGSGYQLRVLVGKLYRFHLIVIKFRASDYRVATRYVKLVGRCVAILGVRRAGGKGFCYGFKITIDCEGALLLLVEIPELDDAWRWHLYPLIESLFARC